MHITRNTFLKSLGSAVIAGSVFNRAAEALTMGRGASGTTPARTRIADVQIWPYKMALKQVVRIALGSEESAENVLVRLRTSDGVTGWGESSPYSPVMSETQSSDVVLGKHLAEMVRGRDPFTIPRIVADMDAFAPGVPGIKAAFEMALWDICGKLSGQPVFKMLGMYRDSFITDLTVFLDKPSVMAERAKDVVRQGFRAVKVKLGESPDIDAERIRSIREAVGPEISLRVDANQGWTPAEAVAANKRLEAYAVEFCEQPIPYWDWDGLKYVREHSPLPIMLDESVHSPHDAVQAVRKDACDMINIKLMKSGGILNAVRIAQIAEAAGMKCMLGCMTESRLGLTAAAHVVAANRSVAYADLDAFTVLEADPIIGGMEVQNGTIRLPDKPGLGLDVDPAFIGKLRPV
jgi:L-alanine-DL-glutamate epimerase-like enolase superfamily enzyme